MALFVNYDNHSLNLVGVHVPKQEVTMVIFFGIIVALYVFFSRQPSAMKFKIVVPVALKFDHDTRWSTKTESVKPFNKYLEEIVEILV